MLDINGSEFLVIAVIAVILVGPERLPEYVRGLRALVKRARGAVHDGQTALRSE
ncbi:MAG: Sec-independent protein translocase TatB, partial [Actinobacteria bacterium HGW-Actinobacteria-8]